MFKTGPASRVRCASSFCRAKSPKVLRSLSNELIDLAKMPPRPPRPVTIRMKAKFTSRCRTCLGNISPGDSVYWTKGSKPRHADCHNRESFSEIDALMGGDV